jgi:uncharacterized membrane protein YphA (DoxX/SURF4 family)
MTPALRYVILPHGYFNSFITPYGDLLIGLGLPFGVLTRFASLLAGVADFPGALPDY